MIGSLPAFSKLSMTESLAFGNLGGKPLGDFIKEVSAFSSSIEA